MTLNEITRKLICQNKSRYILFGLSICFAVAMTGAYGVLLFSKVITDVLMTDGSTYLISLGMYGITLIGIIVFLFYANAIYMQLQMGEIGVFLSLGLSPKSVGKMQNQQLDITFLIGGAAGLVLAVPFSFGIWSLLSLFISYTDGEFRVGWEGLLIAGGLWILVWVILRIRNAVHIARLDVIRILRSSSEGEEVKASHPVLAIIGLIAVPLGLILFNITAVIYWLKSFSVFFLGVSVIGMYILTAQITSIGRIIKCFFPNAYRKDILFYNLVRQKGNQYTLSLFVSSLLITLTIFSICFNGGMFLELYYLIKEEPYDYAVLAEESGEKLDESRICSFAEESGISLNEWHSLDMLLLGREHQYMDVSRNEWASEIVVNVSDFNALSGMNLSVPDDGYIYFQDSDDSMFQTCSEDRGLFYNPCIKEDFTLQKIKLVSKRSVLNETAKINSFAVVSDNTFYRISDTLDSSYKMTYYLFHGSNTENSREFQKRLLAEIVGINRGEIFVSWQNQVIKDKIKNYEDIYIPYDGNELYAARWWEFYPYAKQTELDVQMEAGAVYLILIFFIAIISFVSATMIMGLKIAGTIMQDTESYKRAMYLGLKENDLKKIIRKQIGLIYFFPVICGCVTASFMINRFMEASSATRIFEITLVAIGLSLIVFLMQLIIFFFLQNKLVVSTSRIVYEGR
ncbi:ABC transporter permease [Schaedlerella arabinosiphila]|uniref:ABC transporter permease n=1 Tax=Schaedlerella arabinosiphila TaxID=2044587 RepID=A0A3R8JT59_9FIRM|nr:FtsX-like permease family protein [Schaedlerella arabinosiphila]RRK34994.1 ABC transporter permease [Schaedlerella arabinosiphila]